MHSIRKFVLGALFAVVAVGATAAAADGDSAPLAPLSIEEATADRDTWGLNLSPSGRYVAALTKKDGVNYIVVTDLEDDKAAPFGRPFPEARINWIVWANGDRLLFSATVWLNKRGKAIPTKDLKSAEYALPVVWMFAMDRDGKNLKLLFNDNRSALRSRSLGTVTDFLHDDPQHIVMPAWTHETLDLFKIDVYTGASERIAFGNKRTFLWFTDRNGDPAFRLDVSLFGTAVHIYARKGPAKASPYDREWERVKVIRLRDEQQDGAPDFYPLFAGPQPNTYYVMARPEGSDTSGIYLYDFFTKEFVKTIKTKPGIDIDTMFVNIDTREYMGATYYEDRRVIEMVDPKLQAHLKALDDYFGKEADVRIFDYDESGNIWLLFSTGPRDRGGFHIYQMDKLKVREIARLQPSLDMNRLGRMEVLRYKARDGLEIMGYLSRPPGFKPGDRPPLIMMPHGGPELRDTFSYDSLVQLLVTRGYQVFQPNFRGSSGFGKQFADAGKRQWGQAMQNDLTDAFEFLVAEGIARRDHACIVGASYGGYAALAAATFTPDLYRCVVSISGISDLQKKLSSDQRATRNDEETWEYIIRNIGDPKKDKAMLEAYSPINHVSAVKAPILLIHGDQDNNVPVEQSRMMDEALRKAGKDVQLQIVTDGGHNPTQDELRLEYPTILQFIGQHLPVGVEAPQK